MQNCLRQVKGRSTEAFSLSAKADICCIFFSEFFQYSRDQGRGNARNFSDLVGIHFHKNKSQNQSSQ